MKFTNKAIEKLTPKETPYEVADTDTKGLSVRVQVSGAKMFYFRYRLSTGARGRVRIGDASLLACAQAREKAAEHYAAIVQGEDPAQARRENLADLTLGKFVSEHYQPWAAGRLKSHKDAVARILSGFVPLLSKRLAELTKWDFEKHRAARLKTPLKGRKKPATETTIGRDFAALRAAFSKAVEWGMLAENPLAGIKLGRADTSAVARFLEPAEGTRLLAALNFRENELRERRTRYNAWRRARNLEELPDLRKCKFADHLRAMVLLSLNSGLRRNELFSIEWRDITLEGPAPSLVVRGTVAKNARSRHVPLNQTARETLQAWREQTGSTGLVFKSPKTGLKFDHCNGAWREVLKAAGLFGAFRWHDMRHDFASKLVQAGADLNVVRELLGHSDIKMVLRYAHLAPANRAAAVALLDRGNASNVLEFAKENTQ